MVKPRYGPERLKKGGDIQWITHRGLIIRHQGAQEILYVRASYLRCFFILGDWLPALLLIPQPAAAHKCSFGSKRTAGGQRRGCSPHQWSNGAPNDRMMPRGTRSLQEGPLGAWRGKTDGFSFGLSFPSQNPPKSQPKATEKIRPDHLNILFEII